MRSLISFKSDCGDICYYNWWMKHGSLVQHWQLSLLMLRLDLRLWSTTLCPIYSSQIPLTGTKVGVLKNKVSFIIYWEVAIKLLTTKKKSFYLYLLLIVHRMFKYLIQLNSQYKIQEAQGKIQNPVISRHNMVIILFYGNSSTIKISRKMPS